jgi:hypothetical protein
MHHAHPLPWALLLAALAASACAATPAPNVTVFKPLGSLQCSGGGQTVPALARALADAGVPVLATRCGSDGRMYAAMCGAADGRIGVFDIAAADAAAAAKLGFRPLTPDAKDRPCP